MNIIKLAIFTGLLFPLALSAQEKDTKSSKQFNAWSLELNVGKNIALAPFGDGYSASNENKLLGNISVNHFDIGVRYMLTSKFGMKLDFANDKISNASGSLSLPYESQQYRIGLQGVINAGNLMGFDEFTKTIGLLIHGGIQASLFTPKTGVNKNITEKKGGIMLGVTPQVKLTNNLAFTLDFTVLSNLRQHFAWDGSTSAQANNLNGQMYTTSLGITYSFGKHENHADWVVPSNNNDKVAEINKRVDAVEKLMNDTDRDGIVDHLDTENNTPTGVAVDSKGRFLDVNKNGTPDEMEPRSEGTTNPKSEAVATGELLKTLVDQGMYTVFFDLNQDTPNTASINSISNIIKFLQAYPDTKVKFTGYTDQSGNEQKNSELSKRRVQNMFDLLVKAGVQANRMSIEGVGVDKSNPYSSKTSYDLARRVTIKIE